MVCSLNFRIKKPFRSTQVRQGMPALHKAPITAQIPGPLVQRHPCAASRPAEPRGLLRSSHRELPGGTAEWSNQCPQVQQHTNPTGGHLDPEDRPAPTEEGFNVGTFIVEPAGDSHHHIEGSQEENEVEIGIAIDSASLLIVNDPWSLLHVLLLFSVLSIGAEAKTAPSNFQFRSCISSLQSIRT